MSKTPLKFFFKISLFIGLFLIFFPGNASADVETNLSKALKSGKKTIEFSGKEKESIRIPKGVSVIGSSPDKAIIANDIVMSDGTTLKNITVDGKVIAITLDKGANVLLENVVVTGGIDTGVFAPKGGGTLTIKNSRIHNNRKGVFLLTGKQIIFSGNSVYGNKEEGLDMHSGVGGSVTGSTFSGNGEGGVEVIIDGSSVTISNNTFADNKASGIALQSYGGEGGFTKTGKFILKENTFRNNGNFGIDCKNPQGGGGAYFASSAQSEDNTFTANKKGPIGGECFFSNRSSVDTEAEKTEEKEDLLEETKEEADAIMHAEDIVEKIELKDRYREEIEKIETKAVLSKNESTKPFWKQQYALLLDKRSVRAELSDLELRIQSCIEVTSYELSIDEELQQKVCTKSEKERDLARVALLKKEIEEQSETWQGKIVKTATRLYYHFFEREV